MKNNPSIRLKRIVIEQYGITTIVKCYADKTISTTYTNESGETVADFTNVVDAEVYPMINDFNHKELFERVSNAVNTKKE